MPCPDLWRNVVQNGNPVLPGISRQRKVEARIVDGDQEVDLPLEEELPHLSAQAGEIRQVTDDLRKAQYGQAIKVGQQFNALRGHQAPAQTVEPNAGNPTLQFAGKLGAVQVT